MFQIPERVLSKAKIVGKDWGTEFWTTHEDEYTSKFLRLFPDHQCSLHYHPVKKETFLVLDGVVSLEQRDVRGYPFVEELLPGDSRTLQPGTQHRFFNIGLFEAWILETSTHHEDSDVVRIEKSRRIE